MSPGALPAPLRLFLDRLDQQRSGAAPDMNQPGRLLAELAADQEYFDPLIAGTPSGSFGVHGLIGPRRGGRLALVHRPGGVMACAHSHRRRVAIAPVRGVETHQRWHAVRHPGGRAELNLTREWALHPGYAATLIPPDDVHNHGHVTGTGPHSLILLGDDMLAFEREEYEPELGT